MRSILAVVTYCCLFSTGMSYATDTPSDEATFYRQVIVQKNDSEIEKCAGLLNDLRDMPKDQLNERMWKEHCFDTDSGFTKAGNWTSRESTVSTKAKIERSDSVIAIGIKSFDTLTGADLSRQLSKIPREELDRIETVILAFRGAGGSITGMRDMLASFAPGRGIRYMNATSNCSDVKPFEISAVAGVLGNRRYVILVDNGSGSAFEWATAVMRYELYPDSTEVIGVNADHTFGKNILQRQIAALNMQVTCGVWDIPGRPMVRGVGIRPDRVVKLDDPNCGWEIQCIVNALGLKTRHATALQ